MDCDGILGRGKLLGPGMNCLGRRSCSFRLMLFAAETRRVQRSAYCNHLPRVAFGPRLFTQRRKNSSRYQSGECFAVTGGQG